MANNDQSAALVVSRAPEVDAERRRFEDELVAELGRLGAASVLVIPHVYHLSPGDEATRELARLAAAGRVVVGAWLYARATQWTVSALGCGDAAAVSVVDFRDSASPAACAEAMVAASDAEPGRAGASVVSEAAGAARPRWYPVIDYERCVSCKQCLDFCLFGVYSLDAEGQVRATSPDNCKPGCPACARVCPAGAIMFPEYAASPTIAGSDAPEEPTPKAAVPDRKSPGPEDDGLDDLIDALDRLDDR